MTQIFGELRSLFAQPYDRFESRDTLVDLLKEALETHGTSYFEQVLLPYCEGRLETWPDPLVAVVNPGQANAPNPLHLLYKRGTIALEDVQTLDPYLCKLQEVRFQEGTSPEAIDYALEVMDEGGVKSLELTLSSSDLLPSLMQKASLNRLRHLDMTLDSMRNFSTLRRFETPITSLILDLPYATPEAGIDLACSSFIDQLKHLQLRVDPEWDSRGCEWRPFDQLTDRDALNLERLCLAGQTISIESLPRIMEQTPTLKVLNLAYQFARHLPPLLESPILQQLERLTLGSLFYEGTGPHKIELIQALRTAPLKRSVKHLTLHHMQLTHIEVLEIFSEGPWESLEHLSLVGNNAGDFSQGLVIPAILNVIVYLIQEGLLPNLTTLDIHFNDIREDQVEKAISYYPNLATLRIWH